MWEALLGSNRRAGAGNGGTTGSSTLVAPEIVIITEEKLKEHSCEYPSEFFHQCNKHGVPRPTLCASSRIGDKDKNVAFENKLLLPLV